MTVIDRFWQEIGTFFELLLYVERLWKIRQPKFYIGWYGYQLFADGDYRRELIKFAVYRFKVFFDMKFDKTLPVHWKPRDPNFKQLINAERLNVTKFDYRGGGTLETS